MRTRVSFAACFDHMERQRAGRLPDHRDRASRDRTTAPDFGRQSDMTLCGEPPTIRTRGHSSAGPPVRRSAGRISLACGSGLGRSHPGPAYSVDEVAAGAGTPPVTSLALILIALMALVAPVWSKTATASRKMAGIRRAWEPSIRIATRPRR